MTVHSIPAASTTVGGTYHPLQPARILDTRDGTGGVPKAPIGPGGQLAVTIAGAGLVPVSGAAAVVLNVTVTNTTAPSYLTVFPAGVGQPLASNLNWVAGQTVPNLVEVPVGTGGQVVVFNSAGSTDVVFDVAGYYTAAGAASPGPDGYYNPVVPGRLLDTRSGTGAPAGKLGQGATLNLQVTGQGPIPASGVEAVVMNLTVTNANAPSFLTAWPTDSPKPLASNLNFVAGQTVANRVVVPVSATGRVSIYNASGSTDVVADVNGWFTNTALGGTGSGFSPVTPSRILDSRAGTGGYVDPWGPASGRPVLVAGVGGVPAMTDPNPPTAVVANVTITNTRAASFLTAWPDGAGRPLASDVNWRVGATVPNLVVVQVGATGKVDLYNAAGCADAVVDVVGYFTGPVPVAAPGSAPGANACPGWLTRLNYWRGTAKVAGVSENAVWSNGDYLHSVYMIKNQVIQHSETPGTPYYTVEGDQAAQNSNIAVQSSTSATDEQFIDWWMGAPFHAMGMVDPRLQQSGFGSYREVKSGWQAGAAVDVIRGNPWTGGTWPVYWPGNGTTVPLRTYSGNEFPDPLQACPGYTSPTGLPVFVETGGNVVTTAGAVHSFTGNGTPLAHCVIDSTNANLAPYLKSRGGVIIIPQQPLQPGVVYVVTVTVNSVPYTWSFSVS
jgi:hypothetical protein